MAIVRTGHDSHPAWPFHHLPDNAESLVDVGCNVGEAVKGAHAMGIRRSLGIDINPIAIEEAKKRVASIDGCEIRHASADAIPAPDSSFDVGICLEVIEHVPEELRPGLIREVHRVLKPDGVFILTTPAAGLFAFLDPANMRFRFGKTYDLINRLVGGRGREAGFEGQKHGVIWHEHFHLATLRGLLEPLFTLETVRFRGALLSPLCNAALFPFYRWKKYESLPARMLTGIQNFDNRCNFGRVFGYNVLIVARRANIPAAATPA